MFFYEPAATLNPPEPGEEHGRRLRGRDDASG
jgi:hypothetical protein